MSDYLTIVYRITHPSQPKALLEQAEWSAASHSHAIHDRDRLEGQRDILLEALHEISLCSQNSTSGKEECGRIARAAIAKAEGANND